ncbi:maintenance of telomere capping protein [Trichophyton mentagrophytes]|nr:maintenance of telomere capping protein [Trichophyton mentagrophytes]
MRDFDPDKSASLYPPWNTVELSQRDASLQIPLDHVIVPAVSLSAACFGDGRYEENPTKKCVSNLLSVGYRRLYVDVYWSPRERIWSFCPIDSTVTDSTPATSSMMSPQDRTSSASSAVPTTTSITANIRKRDTLYHMGPYSCAKSLGISTLSDILKDYFKTTENTLNADMMFLIINVHASASPGSPEEPSGKPSLEDLPPPPLLFGKIMGEALGRSIYSPKQLMENRRNLRESWFSVSPPYQPILEYLKTTVDGKNRLVTSTGWPCTGYAVLSQATRLVMGWGTIDPQMSSYNFTGDDLVFPPGSLESRIDVEFASASDLTKGCLYDADTTTLSEIERPWAVAVLPSRNTSNELSLLTHQLASCGISAIVNHTLFNVTADTDISPYQNVSFSTTWSWAKGEPRNSTGASTPKTKDSFRCAAMHAVSSGRWHAHDCNDVYRVACRVGNSPHEWIISKHATTYFNAEKACPDSTLFSVPRTALENTYLYAKLDSESNSTAIISPDVEDNNSTQVLWVDFNSADVPTCWVTHGPRAQCPYELDNNEIERRAILVPTIAAIIVLIVAALTLFVKCNANRRNSRRRRVIDGWDYEGVPS